MWRWLKKTIFKPIGNFFAGIFRPIRNFFAGDPQRAQYQPLLQEEVITFPQQDKISVGDLSGEILMMISDHLPSVKDKAHSASVNRHFHDFFQPEIGKQTAKEAAE